MRSVHRRDLDSHGSGDTINRYGKVNVSDKLTWGEHRVGARQIIVHQVQLIAASAFARSNGRPQEAVAAGLLGSTAVNELLVEMNASLFTSDHSRLLVNWPSTVIGNWLTGLTTIAAGASAGSAAATSAHAI